MSPKTLIVGAGPTGLTLAAMLAEGGRVARVIEQRTEPSPLSRAVGILPSTLDLISTLGISEAITCEAVPIHSFHVHNRGKEIGSITIMPHNVGPDAKCMHALPQDRTEAHLAGAFSARAGEVEYGSTLEALELTKAGAVARINGRDELFDLVIGADGVDSVVRNAVGLDYDGFDIDENWSIADVETTSWPEPRAFNLYFCGDGDIAVVIPMAPGRFRVVSNTPDALQTLPVPIDISRLRRRGTFTISVRQASRYQKGPVFLVGDAAHCHSPVGGRGMNLGIADAVDLATRILRGTTQGYTDARHPIGAAIMRRTETARKLLTSANPLKRGALIAAFRLISVLPFTHSYFARQVIE